MRHSLCIAVALLVLLAAGTARGALMPREVDDCNGREAPAFTLETLTGDRVTLEGLRGRPVVLSYFATWCPPCRTEVNALVKLHERFAARGLAIVGAVADRQQDAETTPEQERKDALELVEKAKLPYPLAIATPELARAYELEGIPITVVIDREGKIAKIFHGLHELKRLEEVVSPLVEAAKPSAAAPVVEKTPSGPGALLAPFAAVFTTPLRQWHPLVVHFPIALLVLEAALCALFWARRAAAVERAAFHALYLAFFGLLAAALAGIRDSGLDQGEGMLLAIGLRDRLANLWRFESTITVHSWLALAVVALTLVRLLWRWRAGPRALEGRAAPAYGALTLVGLWCLAAAAYAGGIITHS
jgi:peroxiredoxin/uncharacterized membrane protein